MAMPQIDEKSIKYRLMGFHDVINCASGIADSYAWVS